jgi:hypothetical protein
MSTQRNDGGPAFPFLELDGAGSAYQQNPGMTLRDYFIAHAPAEPQPWFEPVMPACPSEAPYVNLAGTKFFAHSQAAFEACGKGGYRSSNDKAIADWQVEHSKRRYTQWPAAWADEMLKAREA